MALETGTFVDDLVTSNPVGATDLKSQGDDHLRLIKTTLKNTFPNALRAFRFEVTPAAKTGAYTILATDQRALIQVDVSGGAFTVDLPVGSSVFNGFVVTVMKSDSSSNAVTVDGDGAETINGSLTRTLSSRYEAETYMWDGSEWKTVGLNTTGILNVVEDLTPQAGGIFDMNSFQMRWAKGGDIASASPLVLDTDGNYFDVTGTTGFSQITCTAGTFFMLQFDGALTMTDGANLDLGGSNITTIAGMRCIFFAVAADTAQLLAIFFEGDQRRVDATGAVTNAVQPAFRATNGTLTNVTGDNTDYTIVFATEVFDQNSDFDGTSTFTAPITGSYMLTASVVADGFTGVADTLTFAIVTSNDQYNIQHTETDMGGSTRSWAISIVADMDSADTVTILLDIAGEAKVIDIAAGNAHFSGVLIA